MERVQLQLEGAKTSLAELQQKYKEQEIAKEDLMRQLEKWRTLEHRDGEELGDLRKHKIELEVEVQELRSAADQRELKFKTKVQKYKDSLEEHVVRETRSLSVALYSNRSTESVQ